MHPVLFRIPIFGGVTIFTYGFFVALGFAAAMLWISKESRRVGEDPAKLMDLAVYVIIGGLAASRVFHVLISERDRFFENPLMIFKIWEGGLVFYGGLIGGIAVSFWYFRKHKLPFWKHADIFAPAISIGHALGRVGCLMAGCCFGKVVTGGGWFSITFPNNPGTFAPTGLPLYPTQLMEVVGELIIFSLLFLMRKKKSFDGQLMLVYIIAYSILRFVVEYFRGDLERKFLIDPWISTSQFISIALFISGIIIYRRLIRKSQRGCHPCESLPAGQAGRNPKDTKGFPPPRE